MTQELDLAIFIRTLRRRWLLILLVVALTVGATLIFSLTRPPTYRAQAELIARGPKYQWRFSANLIPIVDERRDWRREFMLLGQTTQVARRVADVLAERPEVAAKRPEVAAERPEVAGDSESTETLLRRVSFRSNAADRIILEASGPSPQAAANLANAWGQVLKIAVSERYGNALELVSFNQLEATYRAQLDAAQQKIEAFKAETGQGVGSTETLEAAGLEPDQKELDSKARLLADYRGALESINRLAQEIADARAGQRASDGGQAQGTAPTAVSWELLQLPILAQRAALRPDKLPSQADLASWSALLQTESAALQDVVSWLNQDVVRLQTQLAHEDSELYRLTRERNLASTTYETILQKLDEIKLQEAIDPVGIDILEEAQLPGAPSSWSLPVSLAVASVSSLIVGVWLALLWQYLIERRLPVASAR